MFDSGAQRHQRCQQAIADNEKKDRRKDRQQGEDQNKQKKNQLGILSSNQIREQGIICKMN